MNQKTLLENAKKIAELINLPTYHKRLSFLFGAGINENIANNPISWEQLAQTSIQNYLKETNKNYSKSALECLGKCYFSSICNNNKLAMSFNSATAKDLLITRKTWTEIDWFIDGFAKMSQAMDHRVEVMTLNYDHVLAEVLHRKSINMLNNDSKNPNQEILHLHGMFDDNDLISQKSLLTLSNYIDHSTLAEKELTDFLLKKKTKEPYVVETIIIIGSSLQEEHILRALKTFSEEQQNRKINIFWINHLLDDKKFIKKWTEIYAHLCIHVMNIRVTDNYTNDFKLFWKLITKNIRKNIISFDNYDIEYKQGQLIDNKLYDQLSNYLIKQPKSQSPFSLQDFLEKIKNLKPHDNEDFIRPIYWLENNKLLEKGSFFDYFFNDMKKIPIYYLSFVTNNLNKKDKKHILRILVAINKSLEKEDIKDFGYEQKHYEIMWFLREFLEDIDIKEMKQSKNIISFLFHKSISSHGTSTSIKDFLIRNFKFSEINYQNNPHIEQAYPQKDHLIYKLFKNNFDRNTNPIPIDLPKTPNDLIKYIKDAKSKNIITLSLYIFLFEKYEAMIIDHYKELLGEIKIFLNHKKIVNDNFHYRLYIIIYFVLIKSSKKNEYLEFMRNFKEFKISEFPINVRILDISDLNFPAYSEYDGEPINQKIKEISSFKEIKDIFKKYKKLTIPMIPMHDKKSIITFLNEMASKKCVEDVIECIKENVEIQTWNYLVGSKIDRIIINAKNLDEYKNFLQKIKDLENEYFIVLNPPYNINKKSDFIEKKLNIKYEVKLFKEMLDIIDIKILLKSYSKEINLWLHPELARMIHIFKKYNKPLSNRIYEIIHKITGWDKTNFGNLLFSKKHIYKDFIELTFASIFNENFSPTHIKINIIIELWEKLESKHFFDFAKITNGIIRMHDDKNLQNKEYNDLIEWMDKLEPNNWSIWIQIFKITMVYNYIITKGKIFLYEKIEPIIIIKAIKDIIDNNSMLEYDKRISNLIDKINYYEWDYKIYFLIKTLLDQKLGKETKNTIFENLKRVLISTSKTDYENYKNYVKKFIKKLNDQQQKEIHAIMKKINNNLE